ncbi:ferritin-like domain-containing protein [Mucidula mucida]|nr:ferritin-like domain-containing protein [Mucidula mucida]
MRYSTSILALAAAPLAVYGAPARIYGKRADSDILVFKFADVLEQLEASFYSTALSKFQDSDFTAAGFTSALIPAELFKVIQSDEQAHSDALQAALKAFGQEPVTSCSFNFDAALGDVATMAATARVVENVGVAAYLGGATLLTDPVLLDAAGSILTIEARHQTILNVLSGTGSAIPQAFDIPFTPSDVLAVAAPFFSGACDLGIPAQPTLSISNTGSVGPGTLLTFASAALNGTVPDDQLFCQMMLGGAPFSIALPLSQCIVPDGVDGPVAIWVTSDGQPLINNVRDRATNKQIAGPTIAFIDTKSEMIGQLARGASVNNGSGSGGEATSTETISPDQASSILASATATASDAGATDVSNSSTDGLPPTANTETGPSPDGKTTVNGWSTTPA